MAGVPHDHVTGAGEGAVQGQGELDRTQVGPEMAALARHGVDDQAPDLGGQLIKLVVGQAPQVGGALDSLEDHRGTHATLAVWRVPAAERYRGTPGSWRWRRCWPTGYERSTRCRAGTSSRSTTPALRRACGSWTCATSRRPPSPPRPPPSSP